MSGLLSLAVVGVHVVVNILHWGPSRYQATRVSETANLIVYVFGWSGLLMMLVAVRKRAPLIEAASGLVLATVLAIMAIDFARNVDIYPAAVPVSVQAVGWLCASVLSMLRWYEHTQQAKNVPPLSPPLKAVIAQGIRSVKRPMNFIGGGFSLVGFVLGIFVIKGTPIRFLLPLAGFALSIISGWLWWSYTVPRWRKWALQQPGVSPDELQAAAQDVKLVYPKGHVFEKTEFRSRE